MEAEFDWLRTSCTSQRAIGRTLADLKFRRDGRQGQALFAKLDDAVRAQHHLRSAQNSSFGSNPHEPSDSALTDPEPFLTGDAAKQRYDHIRERPHRVEVSLGQALVS